MAAPQRDVGALAAGNGPAAEAWRIISATLAEAAGWRYYLLKRYYLFERH